MTMHEEMKAEPGSRPRSARRRTPALPRPPVAAASPIEPRAAAAGSTEPADTSIVAAPADPDEGGGAPEIEPPQPFRLIPFSAPAGAKAADARRPLGRPAHGRQGSPPVWRCSPA